MSNYQIILFGADIVLQFEGLISQSIAKKQKIKVRWSLFLAMKSSALPAPFNIHIQQRASNIQHPHPLPAQFWKVASTRNISIKQRLKPKSRDKASPIGNNNFADR